jgi:hypothetical protein
VELAESVQPFTNKEPGTTVLAVLAELNNIDKHRLVNVTANTAQIGHVLEVADNPGVPVSGDVAIVGMNVPGRVIVTEAGTKIFSMLFENPSLHVRVKTNAETTVAFEKLGGTPAQPVVHILRMLHGGVNHTLHRFDPLFT